MAVFNCSACGQWFQVQDELAGERIPCPACGQVQADLRKPPHVEASGGETVGKGSPPPAELTDFLAPPEAPDEIGRLGPYRVLAVLGHGRRSVVFRAHDPHIGRLVALKTLAPSLAAIPVARERLLREAQALAALEHSNVITLFMVGMDCGIPFLAMELLEGEALEDRLQREGRLPVPEVLRIGRQVAEGLAATHARGLVHRDVKPANIWLEEAGVPPSGGERRPPEGGTPTGRVKLFDFWLVRSLADQTHRTRKGAIVGTPAYMAPEQARGEGVDHRCDLFSLGCVLYRMATGELPFKGPDVLALIGALALETPPAPRERNHAIPAALSELILRMLAKKPEDRPATAQAVADALAALGEGK
jgi:serine/threonine protein kinase